MSDSYFVRGFLKRTLSLIATLKGQIETLEAQLSAGGAVVDISGLEAAIAAVQTDLSNLATVATTGNYLDLTNKPTIPTLPTLATVATSGSYTDLTNKPTLSNLATTGNLSDSTGKLTRRLEISTTAPTIWFVDSDFSDHSVRLGFNNGYLQLQRFAGTTLSGNVLQIGTANSNPFLYGSVFAGANNINLGQVSAPFQNLYLLNSPIVSSDDRGKGNQRRLSPQELEVGKAILDLVYTREGDPSLHLGVSAQQVAQAFVDRGLDPADYALNIDEDGVLGVRYTELFILLQAAIRAYLEQHRVELNDLNVRLSALEGT